MKKVKFHNPYFDYRSDIDGLRAVAVLSVLIFHAFPDFLKGGFIGVDVFFVISGFLISNIIIRSLNAGTFRFVEFYSRRIIRLFPSMVIVLFSSFILGWFFLLGEEFKQFGKHSLAGVGFLSNIVYLNEIDYFNNVTDTMPLLHLWSLGVEEQFYIFFPCLLWFCWRMNINISLTCLFILIVSFVLNVQHIDRNSIVSFYSPFTRIWELIFGVILALNTKSKIELISKQNKIIELRADRRTNREIFVPWKVLSNVISLLALAALICSFFVYSKQLLYPGYWALLPVLASGLIIISGPNAWVNRNILSNKVLVWFGIISFPLYLWHWPLLSFARIIAGTEPSIFFRICIVTLSIILSWLTYRFVELPIRFAYVKKFKVCALIASMLALGFLGGSTYLTDGYQFRDINRIYNSYANSIKVPERASECFEIPYAYRKNDSWFCSLGNNVSSEKFFAYGDSHALSLLPALEQFAIQENINIKFAGTSGCPPVLGVQSVAVDGGIEKFNCKELNERIFNYVKNSDIKTVILASRWTYYINSISRPTEFAPLARNSNLSVDKLSSTNDLIWAINNTVLRYSSIGVKVIFIEDVPQQKFNPRNIIIKGRGLESEYLKMSVALDEHVANQSFVNKALRASGASTINLDDILCPDGLCILVANSNFLYSDDDHLSIAGSIFVSQVLSARILEQIE
jgi:peptidoglycan/LPS O-acetylase OafA/YrhL